MFWDYVMDNWLIFLIAIILGMIYLFSRKNRKIQQEYTEKWEKIGEKVEVGAKVTLDSGIHGVIKEIHEKSYMIEIAKDVIIECEKYGVVFVQ